jgi:hypothetical protein
LRIGAEFEAGLGAANGRPVAGMILIQRAQAIACRVVSETMAAFHAEAILEIQQVSACTALK